MIVGKKQRIKEYYIKNPNATFEKAAIDLGLSMDDVRRRHLELRREAQIPDIEVLTRDIKTTEQILIQSKEKKSTTKLSAQHNRLIKDYEQLLENYEAALALKEPSSFLIPTISLNSKINSQAVPIIQWGDWHVEERIEKVTTRGLNEYNPTIAEKRADKCALNTLKIIKMFRQDVNIREIFIVLGGDFINNYLHEHDVQMNFMSPIEAMLFAKYLLVKELSTLAKYGEFKKITVMCIRGNHPRLTKKMQSSNDYKMNLEAIIYYMLKQELSDNIFEWHIPESELGYINIYGKLIRSFHGHQVKFQGGVGDITVPINKIIMKWDKNEKADWNLMHHYHSYWTPTRNCSLNGSLCGYNSYALSLGLPFEPPLQTIQLLDAKRGFTVRTPIFCE